MRLIVVDDDRLVVDSLKIILGAQPQIEVVGTGANGNDAVSLYAEHAPDIARSTSRCRGATDFRPHARSLSATLRRAWCF